MPGKVYLVGAGPGAPDLITVRGAQRLAAADIVFYDALVHPDTLALATKAKKIPVGKRCGKLSTAQRFINKALVAAAGKFQNVVRLKGGDPMLFGRAQEEIAALQEAGIEYEVVPGITAALGASSSLGVSLTQRGISRSVTFATPRIGPETEASEWVRSAAGADTAVLYMGVGQAPAIVAALVAGGRSAATPVVVVENATLANERRVATTLAGLAAAEQWGLTGPALILLGEVYRNVQSSGDVAEAPVAAVAA